MHVTRNPERIVVGGQGATEYCHQSAVSSHLGDDKEIPFSFSSLWAIVEMGREDWSDGTAEKVFHSSFL